MLFLNGKTNDSKLPLGDIHVLTTHLDIYKRDKQLTLDDLKKRFETYTSVLFVRNPFTRALSAYRDKFQSSRSLDHNVVRNLYENKMLAYRNRSIFESQYPNRTVGVTFGEYVKFLSDQRQRSHYDEHWAPMSEICFPCQMKYDIIGKLESFEEDSRLIFNKLGTPELLDVALRRPPHTTHSSESLQIQQYFKTLSKEDIEGLRHKYANDFGLFGYDIPFNNTDG